MSRASHIDKHDIHDLQKYTPSLGRYSKSYVKGQEYISFPAKETQNWKQ